MHTNNLEQLITFIYFILTGVLIGIIFDIFRIFRRSFKTVDIVTNIQDIIFAFISTIVLLISIYIFNNGELRLYIFIGLILGNILYLKIFSKFFIKLNVRIIKLLKKIILYLIFPFKIFFKFIKKLIFRPISFIFINFKKITKKIDIKLKNKRY